MPSSVDRPPAGPGSSDGNSSAGAAATIIDVRPCPVCGEPIKTSARKCVHCDSSLDWRKYVGLSSTTLAILTALVAVIGQSAPAVRSLWDVKDSKFHFTFMGAGSRRAVLDGRVLLGDVILLASNEGLKAGGIVTGRLLVSWTSDRRQHAVSSALWTPGDEPEIVGPGSAIGARLWLDASIDLETGTEASDVRELIKPGEEANPLTAPIEKNAQCAIGVEVVNANGSTEQFNIPVRCVAFHPFLQEAIKSAFP